MLKYEQVKEIGAVSGKAKRLKNAESRSRNNIRENGGTYNTCTSPRLDA
jgi:hypothetical protein